MFGVEPTHGYLPETTEERVVLPVEVWFRPEVDGKVMEGLLVVDTKERQFRFRLVGTLAQPNPLFFVTSTEKGRPNSQRTSQRNSQRSSPRTPRRTPR